MKGRSRCFVDCTISVVSIALDDFGTGYSSLSYLRSFPFDSIKIDRLFISEMATREDCTAIVGAIVSLADKLGMTTTAEGVETDEQLRLVRDLGCTTVQGYLIGRPQPIHKVIEYIEALRQPPYLERFQLNEWLRCHALPDSSMNSDTLL